MVDQDKVEALRQALEKWEEEVLRPILDRIPGRSASSR